MPAFKTTIRFKLLVGFALLTAISTIVQFLVFNFTREYTLTQIAEFQKEKSKDASQSIDAFFTSMNSYIQGIAKADNIDTMITYVLDDNKYIKRIAILNPLGKELKKYDRLGPVPEEKLNYEIASKPLSDAVNGKTSISDVYYVDNDPSPYIDIYAPVISSGNSLRTIIKIQIGLESLWNIISNIKIGTNGYAYVVDSTGRVIAHPNLKYLLTRPQIASRPLIADVMKPDANTGTNDHIYINERGIESIGEATRNTISGWIIVFEQPTAEAFSYINFVRNLFVLTLIGSLAILLLIAVILSNNIAIPIRQLQQAVQYVENGKYDTHISIASGDETEDLAHAFNTMLTNLQNSMQAIESRDFNIKRINEELELEKEFISAEKNKLTVVLSGISDAVIAVNLQRNIITFNTAAEKLLGYKSAEVIGRSIDEIISVYEDSYKLPPDTYCPVRQDDYEGVLYGKKEVRIDTSHAKQIFGLMTTSKIREGAYVNLGAIISIHDITSERQLEEMKLDFVSMAAHELRTPLTSIRGYLSVFMEESKDQFSGEQLTFLNRINVAADQLVALVENLLNVTRIERGAFTVNIAPVDWVHLARDTTNLLMDRAAEKHINLAFVEPQIGTKQVMADKLRITEVLTNLLANAVSYTSPGGSIWVSIEYTNDEVITHVRDTGEGIPKDALTHLFTKFFRVSGKLAQGSKGTGLGLYISKAIVEMHKGHIWVESQPGVGSTFSFSLPTAKS